MCVWFGPSVCLSVRPSCTLVPSLWSPASRPNRLTLYTQGPALYAQEKETLGRQLQVLDFRGDPGYCQITLDFAMRPPESGCASVSKRPHNSYSPGRRIFLATDIVL